MTAPQPETELLPDLTPEQLQEISESKPYHKGITTDQIVTFRLKHPNLTREQAAQLLEVHPDTLSYHLKKEGLSWPSIIQQTELFKDTRADLLAFKQAVALENITDEKLKKTPAAQLATVFGILYDKERLERGQSTANVAYADLGKKEQDLMAQLKAQGIDIDADVGEEDTQTLPDPGTE